MTERQTNEHLERPPQPEQQVLEGFDAQVGKERYPGEVDELIGTVRKKLTVPERIKEQEKDQGRLW